MTDTKPKKQTAREFDWRSLVLAADGAEKRHVEYRFGKVHKFAPRDPYRNFPHDGN